MNPSHIHSTLFSFPNQMLYFHHFKCSKTTGMKFPQKDPLRRGCSLLKSFPQHSKWSELHCGKSFRDFHARVIYLHSSCDPGPGCSLCGRRTGHEHLHYGMCAYSHHSSQRMGSSLQEMQAIVRTYIISLKCSVICKYSSTVIFTLLNLSAFSSLI